MDIDKEIENIETYISRITSHFNEIKKQYIKELIKANSIRKKLLNKKLNKDIPSLF